MKNEGKPFNPYHSSLTSKIEEIIASLAIQALGSDPAAIKE
jgi:hypothetical protein